MFICSNCRQFVYACDDCKKDVCSHCILIGDEVGVKPYYNSYSQLRSKCQCAGCIQVNPGNLCVGYDVCSICDMQFCDGCFKNPECHDIKHIK